jgi:hypothetical protein
LSKPKQQHKEITELELQALILTMRAFDIHNLQVEGRPNCVRFIGSPYNAFVEDCRSMQVNCHARGKTGRGVCPLGIKALLDKFEIPEEDFLAALNTGSRPKPNAPADVSSEEESGLRPPLVN